MGLRSPTSSRRAVPNSSASASCCRSQAPRSGMARPTSLQEKYSERRGDACTAVYFYHMLANLAVHPEESGNEEGIFAAHEVLAEIALGHGCQGIGRRGNHSQNPGRDSCRPRLGAWRPGRTSLPAALLSERQSDQEEMAGPPRKRHSQSSLQLDRRTHEIGPTVSPSSEPYSADPSGLMMRVHLSCTVI